MKHLLIFSLTLLPCFFTLSQQASRTALSFYGGPAADWKELFSEDAWKQLVPGSASVADTSVAFRRTSTGSSSWCDLSVQLAFPETRRGRLTPLIVFSLGAGPGGLEAVSFEREGIATSDTIVSGQGETYVVDSAYSESYSHTYTSRTANIGTRVMLRTHESAFGLSLQFGLGINYAFPLNSTVSTLHTQRSAVYLQGKTQPLPESVTERSTAAAPGTSRLVVCVPVRLQYRFFKHLLLGCELSPGWASTRVSGQGRRDSVFFMTGMGIVWELPDNRPTTVPAYEAWVRPRGSSAY